MQKSPWLRYYFVRSRGPCWWQSWGGRGRWWCWRWGSRCDCPVSVCLRTGEKDLVSDVRAHCCSQGADPQHQDTLTGKIEGKSRKKKLPKNPLNFFLFPAAETGRGHKTSPYLPPPPPGKNPAYATACTGSTHLKLIFLSFVLATKNFVENYQCM